MVLESSFAVKGGRESFVDEILYWDALRSYWWICCSYGKYVIKRSLIQSAKCKSTLLKKNLISLVNARKLPLIV